MLFVIGGFSKDEKAEQNTNAYNRKYDGICGEAHINVLGMYPNLFNPTLMWRSQYYMTEGKIFSLNRFYVNKILWVIVDFQCIILILLT